MSKVVGVYLKTASGRKAAKCAPFLYCQKVNQRLQSWVERGPCEGVQSPSAGGVDKQEPVIAFFRG